MAAAPPDLDERALAAGASALGLALTDAQIRALSSFGELLARWNRVYNLTAIRVGERMLTHHLLDSLSLVAPLQTVGARSPQAPLRVLDVGSGGGLPGIPLAIACPHVQVTLVDTVQKKTAFLTQAALELRLTNVRVLHARVENLSGQFDVITSRAFAALADFVAWTRHLLAPGGCWLAMKGRLDPAELAVLPPSVSVFTSLPLAVPGLAEERHLLEIRPI
ncbi:MAG: 16S rRNA (guanine(527)-N(7))-methyltransferase RsmG [Burkholderiaceae bacterium]|nr:16S rRNA (guanine(527)-N(7))-methyltransferase RsmG [Burkholderiaceae bacterium]